MAESLKDCKARYVAAVKDVFSEERDLRMEKTIGLQRGSPRLRPLQVKREEESTIAHTGTLLEQAEVARSPGRYCPSRVQDLFVPDGGGFVPRTVVMVGLPGIGKTVTCHHMMLGWASGDLYADTFHFLFYLSAREINRIEGNVDLVGLVTQSSPLPCSEVLLKAALNDPAKVLLILDGFDELRWTLEDDYEDHDDPFLETHKETFLRHLLSKELLPEVSLVITSRSMCLQKVKDLVQTSCSLELLGFSHKDLEEYLRAEDLVVEAIPGELLALCSVPLTCWLVCRTLRTGVTNDWTRCRTLSSVYLLYLKSLLQVQVGSKQEVLDCVKKLCALANEGVMSQRSLFDEEDLRRHGLTFSQILSVFPNDSIFRTSATYRFLHLTLQEFFSALYYVLGEDAEIKENNGVSGDTYLPKICKGKSLYYQSEHHPYLVAPVRFLFGLLNHAKVQEFAGGIGSNVSTRAKAAMEQWLVGSKASVFCLDALTCIYEAQDQELCHRVVSTPDLSFQQSYTGAMENVPIREMEYCLVHLRNLNSISLEDLLLRPRDLSLLSPFFHASSKLSFVRCGFAGDLETGENPYWLSNPESRVQELEFHVCVVTPTFFQDLSALISSSRSLTKLLLIHHNLEDSSLHVLCAGLCHPGCTLQELTLDDCNLTVTSCQILGPAIKENRSLLKLDLALNNLQDEGVRFLCEGLKDPACTVRELMISFCDLTPACCDYLRSLLISSRSLTVLSMRDNDLQDRGAKLLCAALQQPGCTLRELRLHESNITASSCEDFRSLLLTNRTLTTLDLTYNDLQDCGVKTLCEGVGAPGCVLQELILLHCELTATCCPDLLSILTTNPSLTHLDLTWNPLGDPGVKVLCQGLRDPRCSLKNLRLSGCSLSSSSLLDLAAVISRTRTLTTLDLSGNQFGNDGVRELCDALRGPACTMQEISVGYCDLTPTCAEQFLVVIDTNRSLEKLDVSFGYEDGTPCDLEVMCARFRHPHCTMEVNETQDGTFIYFKYRRQK